MNRIFFKTINQWILVSLLLAAGTAAADIKVFACEPEWAALAGQLGGDKLEAFSATSGKQDPHQIQARPSLISQIRSANLLICSGADLEIGWLPLLLRRSGNPRVQAGSLGYFLATEHVKLLGIPKVIDRSQGDVHAAGNPHVQTNPKNIARIAKALLKTMQKVDTSNAAYYQMRYQQFIKRWNVAVKKWKAQMRPFKGLPIVVQHQSWDYLEDFTGLVQVATIEEKPGIPPSSGHLASLLNQLKTTPAKIIIHAAYQDGKASRWLAQKSGIPVVKLPFTVGGDEQSGDLFSLYERTFNLLQQALQQ